MKTYTLDEFANALITLERNSTEVESITEAIKQADCVVISISYHKGGKFLKDGDICFFHKFAPIENHHHNYQHIESKIKEVCS